jgi:hypothetical protein
LIRRARRRISRCCRTGSRRAGAAPPTTGAPRPPAPLRAGLGPPMVTVRFLPGQRDPGAEFSIRGRNSGQPAGCGRPPHRRRGPTRNHRSSSFPHGRPSGPGGRAPHYPCGGRPGGRRRQRAAAATTLRRALVGGGRCQPHRTARPRRFNPHLAFFHLHHPPPLAAHREHRVERRSKRSRVISLIAASSDQSGGGARFESWTARKRRRSGSRGASSSPTTPPPRRRSPTRRRPFATHGGVVVPWADSAGPGRATRLRCPHQPIIQPHPAFIAMEFLRTLIGATSSAKPDAGR